MVCVVEDFVDDELYWLEKMDGDALEDIRRKRLEVMKLMYEVWKSVLECGYGVVNDLDDEKVFFEKMKGEDKMIVYFYRISSWSCEVMDKYVAAVARKYMEMLVCRINVEKLLFLMEKFKIWMLLMFCLICNIKVVDYIVGFDDVGGMDDFFIEYLRLVFVSKGVINYEGGDNDCDVNLWVVKKVMNVIDKVMNICWGVKMVLNSDDEDSDFDWWRRRGVLSKEYFSCD